MIFISLRKENNCLNFKHIHSPAMLSVTYVSDHSNDKTTTISESNIRTLVVKLYHVIEIY